MYLMRRQDSINSVQAKKLSTTHSKPSQKSFQTEHVLDELGIGSSVFDSCIKCFYQVINDEDDDGIIKNNYNKWFYIYEKLYDVDSLMNEKIIEYINKIYNISNEINLFIFLFCIHTYYALICKLLTVKLLFEKTENSYFKELLFCDTKNLHDELVNIENNLFLDYFNIENYPKDNVFNWYVNTLNDSIYLSIKQLIKTLNEYNLYDRNTISNNIDILLKNLYLHLIPKQIRHAVGEYYTPNWIVELIYKQLDDKKLINKSIIDPTCGSGTFLIYAINLKKNILIKNSNKIYKKIDKILSSIQGIDLNPLAVLSAKTNYIICIRDLIKNNKNPISIPIYLEDSLLYENKKQFDYVLGNPPWVNWEHINEHYRKNIKDKFEEYNLIKKGVRIGATKIDLSALFTYVSLDKYLKKDGRLCFVITQSLFKSKAGRGFRQLTLSDKTPIKFEKFYDLVDLQPFETALNRTAIVIMQKGTKTSYPIKYYLYHKKKNKKIHSNMTYKDVKENVIISELFGAPLYYKDNLSPLIAGSNVLINIFQKITGINKKYISRMGVNTGGGSSIFWIRILDKFNNNIIKIENIFNAGRKHSPKVTNVKIEKNLVYPLIKGKNIKRWDFEYKDMYIVLPHDKESGMTAIDEKILSKKYPRTLSYFKNDKLKTLIESRRAIHYRWGGSTKWWYSLFEIGPYTFAPYKVAYKGQLTTKLVAVVLHSLQDKYLGKKLIIPDQTVTFIPLDSKEEAYFLCALLNSVIFRLLYKSLLYKHPSTFLISYLNIPNYDVKNELHKSIANLPLLLHGMYENKIIKDREKIEKEINEKISLLYKLTEKEKKETIDMFKLLDNK